MTPHGVEGRPDGGFAFPAGGDTIWTHGDGFAWHWRNGGLVITTKRHKAYIVDHVYPDLIVMTDGNEAYARGR